MLLTSLSATRAISAISRRSSTAALACGLASRMAQHATGFSTTSAASSIASLLNDPSLLGDSLAEGKATTFDVFDPGASAVQFDEGSAVIAKVRRMGREDAMQAIERASGALSGWKDGTTALQRSGILSQWSNLIKENAEDVAKIMTLESGKPLQESRGEINYGCSFLEYSAAEAVRPNSAGGGYIAPSPFTASGSGAPRGKIMASKT